MMPAPTTTTSGCARGTAEGGLIASRSTRRARGLAKVVDPPLELMTVHRDIPADFGLAGGAEVAARVPARPEQHAEHGDPRVQERGRMEPQRAAEQALRLSAIPGDQLVA